MSRKSRAAFGARRVSKSQLNEALLTRVRQRAAASGIWKLPAVPALLDTYLNTASELFAAAGRHFSSDELGQMRELLARELASAFAVSQRSKVSIRFECEAAAPLGFEIASEATSIAETYERWVGSDEQPLFGAHADARLLSLAAELGEPSASKILDLGAGTGRNALALARRGHPVDALEVTPRFATMITESALREGVAVRVVESDLFDPDAPLGKYRMVVASEVVPDFRGSADLRKLFELADRVLEDGGLLVMNLHLAAHGYTPERAAREFAEQCYSALFTASDLGRASAGLPFACVSNESVHDYERTHLPAEAWPPTAWFVNWVFGLDVYEVAREASPVELRWLVFEKRARDASPVVAQRARLASPEMLRSGIVKRLKHRAVASGTLILPALPALLDEYEAALMRTFRALERELSAEQRGDTRRLLADALERAFTESPRSNVVVSYEAPLGAELTLRVDAEAVSLAEAYEDWLETLPPPVFGAEPDARFLALLESFPSPKDAPVLDLGAGLGRNALAAARRGHPVDTLDLSKRFVEMLESVATAERLEVRAFCGNLLDEGPALDQGYALVLLSGVVGDLRDERQLRALFELSASRLRPGGYLLLNAHLASDDEALTLLARQWGQQCCAMPFTRGELGVASAGLGFELCSDDSAHDFEAAHAEPFPPTPVYVEWATAQHMYALPREDSPIELRWLCFRKSG